MTVSPFFLCIYFQVWFIKNEWFSEYSGFPAWLFHGESKGLFFAFRAKIQLSLLNGSFVRQTRSFLTVWAGRIHDSIRIIYHNFDISLCFRRDQSHIYSLFCFWLNSDIFCIILSLLDVFLPLFWFELDQAHIFRCRSVQKNFTSFSSNIFKYPCVYIEKLWDTSYDL